MGGRGKMRVGKVKGDRGREGEGEAGKVKKINSLSDTFLCVPLLH